MNYFTTRELACRCCGKAFVDNGFLDKLNRAREMAGFPFVVDSGFRCAKHNKAVGSTSENHVLGEAADIRCFDDSKRFVMVQAMIEAGMTGIGVGPKYVHCDTLHQIGHIWVY